MVHHRAFLPTLQGGVSFMPGIVSLFHNYDYNPLMLAIQLMGQNQKKRVLIKTGNAC